MTPLSHDSAVSLAPLSHISEVSLTPLSQNWAVSLTPLSQWKSIFTYDLAPWLSGVIDTAESKLRGVIDTTESKLSGVTDTAESKLSGVTDTTESKLSGVTDTAESKLSGVIDTTESAKTPLSQFYNFERLLFSLKRQSNKIHARVNFTTLRLQGKSLKNGGCLRKFFWLSGVNDTAESTLSSNISVNSKLFAKTLKGLKQWPRGKMFDEKKNEVKNLVRLSL